MDIRDTHSIWHLMDIAVMDSIESKSNFWGEEGEPEKARIWTTADLYHLCLILQHILSQQFNKWTFNNCEKLITDYLSGWRWVALVL